MKKLVILLSACFILVGCGGSKNGGYHKYTDRKATRYFPAKRVATGKKTFVFAPRRMSWAAYDEEGYRVRVGRASGGVDKCPEDGADCRTVTGNFSVKRKGDSTCESQSYPVGVGGAPMPYCMYFHQGYAIHGSPDVPDVPASHGCIRVETNQARWLNQDFLDVGSNVIVEPY